MSDLAETAADADAEADPAGGRDLQDSSLAEGAAGLLAMTSTADAAPHAQVSTVVSLCNDCIGSHKSCAYIKLSLLRNAIAVKMQ